MADDIKELQETSGSHPPISAQDVAIDETEEAMTCLRISPRKVLASLGHLRIEKARIKPFEDKAPKAGGKADVEAAILVQIQSSDSPGPKDAEYVAVKKLRFDTDTDEGRALAPFAHEVNLLNDLSHPSVVKIIGFVEDVEQSIAWMVFSWETNGNLREFVRSANWELPERVSLIDDVARGLDYLHGRTREAAMIRLQHRITSAFTVESLKAEPAESGDFITMTGPAWTMRWAAPELLEGELPGLSSDIWAFGWICWEAITGNFPFDEENDLAIVLRITKGDLPAVGDNAQLKQVKELCSLMGRCWSLHGNERPTAMRCQQEISFMDQVIPSKSKLSGSATTRSSGLLYALGWIQRRNGMMSEAEKYFQESFVVAKSAGDKQGSARALCALGGVYYLQDEYSKAEMSYIQARDTYSEIGNQLGFADSVSGLGDVYRMRSEYSKAEELYIQARDAYSRLGNRVGFANAVKGLGDVYQTRSEYSKAEESYIQARDTFSQIGNQLGFANSIGRLGDVYRMRNQYSTAEELYIQARDTYSQLGDQVGFANSVWGLGEVYRMQSEYSNAKELYIQARNAYSQIGDQLGFAASAQGLGQAFSAFGQYSQAEQSYLEAQAVYRQIGDTKSLANILWYLGWLRRRQEQYGEAKRLVSEASTIYGNLGLKDDVADCDEFLEEVQQLTAA